MCGFANPISFKNITEDHIRQVENFIKEKCLIILQNRLAESFGEECDVLVAENDMQDHFGIYADGDVSLFEFQAGDIVLIKGLVDHVNQIINEKGLHHFRKRFTAQKVAETKRMKTTVEIIDLKSQLLQKVIALFTVANRLNETTFPIEEITQDFVIIHNDNEQQIHGEIVCIACNIEPNRKKKSNPKKVAYHIDRNGNGCWVMSNFKTHLQRSHHLIIENVRPKKVCAKLSDDPTCVVDGSHSTDQKIDSIGDDANNIEYVTDKVNDDAEDASVVITNDDDIRRIEEADTDTQTTLISQLSEQTTNVLASILNHKEQQEKMDFVLGKSPRKVTVAKVPKDNNCIFGTKSGCQKIASRSRGTHFETREFSNVSTRSARLHSRNQNTR